MNTNDGCGGTLGAVWRNDWSKSGQSLTTSAGPRHTIAIGTDTLAHLRDVRRELAKRGIDVLSANATAVYLLRQYAALAADDRAVLEERARHSTPRKGQRGSTLSFGVDDWSLILSMAFLLSGLSGKRFSPTAAVAWLAWGIDIDAVDPSDGGLRWLGVGAK